MRVHTSGIRMTYGLKKKVNLFKAFRYSSFEISDLEKNSLHLIAVLSYLPKLKWGMGLTWSAHIYCIVFQYKCFLFNTLSIDKVQYHFFFPSQDIKQNVLLSHYLNNWWRHKLEEFIFNHPLNHPLSIFPSSFPSRSLRPTGKRWGKNRKKKIWISRGRKELFRWNKSIFHNYLRVFICWINKITDTSLKLSKNFTKYHYNEKQV